MPLMKYPLSWIKASNLGGTSLCYFFVYTDILFGDKAKK